MGIDVTIARTIVAPVAVAILAIASLEACARRQVPPLAELPPSTLPAPPAPRPAVEQNQAQGELAAIGAIQTVQGWTLLIANAKFRAGRLVIEPGDRTIDEVVTTLKNRPRLRVLIEAHVDQKGSSRHARSISQRRADEVLQALTAKGVEGSQIQAQGRANALTGLPGDPGVMLIFSNAKGEFASTALAP
jgi:outer membrane protein OmpA-like peptidoglycan-associated protein